MYTGNGTYPLDVAYDAARHRILVASADLGRPAGHPEFHRPARKDVGVGTETDQGSSDGGAQGVTVDGEGNYWVTLPYHNIPVGGVVIKIDAVEMKPRLILRDLGMNNPNGIVTSPDGASIIVMSGPRQSPSLQPGGRTHARLPYCTGRLSRRGVQNELWVCGWLAPGRMVRINLKNGSPRGVPVHTPGQQYRGRRQRACMGGR